MLIANKSERKCRVELDTAELAQNKSEHVMDGLLLYMSKVPEMVGSKVAPYLFWSWGRHGREQGRSLLFGELVSAW